MQTGRKTKGGEHEARDCGGQSCGWVGGRSIVKGLGRVPLRRQGGRGDKAAAMETAGKSQEVGTGSHILKMADLLPSIILRKSE